MIKREIKANFKSFILWLLILIGIFLVVFLIYPSIVSDNNIKQLDEMMKMFPPEILKTFNMDITSINSAYGWLKTEGFTFILLITGSYASILGANILLKEENDKNIEYLNSLPVSRSKILFSKVLVGISYIILMILLLGIFNYVCLNLSGSFDKNEYLLLSMTPLFSSLTLFFISLFLSTFAHKTKKMFGISLGITFISYIFNVLATLAKTTEFLKCFSVFSLADIRNVIINDSINISLIILTILISSTLLLLSILNYNKKEFI